MLRRGISFVSHRSMSGPRGATGLSVKDLQAINLHSTHIDKVKAAVDLNQFPLAALIALKSSRLPLNLATQQRIVRGLIQYHPRLTPVNLQALEWLHKRFEFQLESVDKALLIRSLISYGDHQLIRSAVDFLDRVRGGPVPNSAIMGLVRFSKDRNAVESCIRLWEYVRHNYPLTFPEYTAIMVDLMEVFARSRTYRHMAEDVARACLANASNRGIALSIAKVCYKLENEKLARELLASPGLVVTDRIEATLRQLNARTGGKLKPRKNTSGASLTPQELSGIVKAVAEHNVQDAEHLVNSFVQDEAGDGALNGMNYEDSQRALLAHIALCNQYISTGSLPKFKDTLSKIQGTANANSINGIVLNLKLKWELSHGSFNHAKRHFQNFENVPVKQRALALNTLSSLAKDESDRLWVATERKRLEPSAQRPSKHLRNSGEK